MTPLTIAERDIVRIKPYYLSYYQGSAEQFVDYTERGRVTCVFRRYNNQMLEMVDMATVSFINRYRTSVNIPMEHLEVINDISVKRDKFISLMKRLTQEDRELLMAENCYSW